MKNQPVWVGQATDNPRHVQPIKITKNSFSFNMIFPHAKNTFNQHYSVTIA